MEAKNKKQNYEVAEFSLGELVGAVILFVVIGIVIGVGVDILSGVQQDQVVNSIGYNASTQAIAGISKFSGKLVLIATVIVAAVVVGIVIRYLYVGQGGMGGQ